MKNKIYFMFGMIFIMGVILTFTIITKAGEITSANFDVINLSDNGATVIKTKITNHTWRLETEETYTKCVKGEDTGIVGLNCSQPTYTEFLDYWTRLNEENLARREAIASGTYVEPQVKALQDRITALETENKMLRDCIINSLTYEELQKCVNGK